MTSTEFQSDPDTLSSKINAALISLFDECESDNSIKDECNSKLPSYIDMMFTYVFHVEYRRNMTNFQYASDFISSEFPFHDLIVRSKILEDKKLFEAVLYSKIFMDVEEFDANRHKYKSALVWVANFPLNDTLRLVSLDRIIYSIEMSTLNEIRDKVRKTWAILSEKVVNNLTEAFSKPERTRDRSSAPLAPVAQQSRYPMTDELKKILLDELNSLNLDARIKQQFAFDLKVRPDKDLIYWLDRIDALRLCSNTAVVVSSQDSQEMQQLSQIITKLEKMMERNEAHLISAAERIKGIDTVDSQLRSQELQNSWPVNLRLLEKMRMVKLQRSRLINRSH
ncbi:hypothetical protein V9T40_011062 [Parthenolecanium corni]|uniref:Uncharacterized protein n=1 Tax=Parthenolecanium corni TaxID=536013 RepID=A0AAN9TJ99_9HEMI